MCIRTVEGNDISEQSLDTVPGESDTSGRYVSNKQTNIVLAGTTPTITEIVGPASGTYTTPAGCVYIDVYVVGAGAGGSNGGTSGVDDQYGNGGGGGDVSFGMFAAGAYTYSLHAGSITTAAQFSTFGILKASGGLEAQTISSNNIGRGKWNNSTALKNSLINFGYSPSLPGGRTPSAGGQCLFNGLGGAAIRSDTAKNGAAGSKAGGGGSGGNLTGLGATGGPSALLVIEYY